MNPMAMMNPMAAMFQMSSPPGLTMTLPATQASVDDVEGEEAAEDGGAHDDDHGDDVTPERASAVTPKKAAPPTRPRSLVNTEDTNSDVISDAMAQINATRAALFQAQKGEMPIPRSIKFVGALPKARSHDESV